MPVARRAVKRNQPEMYDCLQFHRKHELFHWMYWSNTRLNETVLDFEKIKRSEALSVDRLKTVCLNVVHVE